MWGISSLLPPAWAAGAWAQHRAAGACPGVPDWLVAGALGSILSGLPSSSALLLRSAWRGELKEAPAAFLESLAAVGSVALPERGFLPQVGAGLAAHFALSFGLARGALAVRPAEPGPGYAACLLLGTLGVHAANLLVLPKVWLWPVPRLEALIEETGHLPHIGDHLAYACSVGHTLLVRSLANSGRSLPSALGLASEVHKEAPKPEGEEETRFGYAGPGPWSASLPDAVVPPRLARAGPAGPDTPASTIPQMMQQAVKNHGQRQALLVERPVPALVDGKAPPALPLEQWTQWTYQTLNEDVRKAAKGFMHFGFAPFDTVNVWGFNSPEWVTSALAANFAGGKVAGLYPTDTPEAAAYKVVHSGGSIVVVEDRAKVEKLLKALQLRGDARRIRAVVAWGFEPAPGEALSIQGCGSVPLVSWGALLEAGSASPGDAAIDARVSAASPGHCAALIYTSGTTGEPKAVMISHDNIIFEAAAVLTLLRPCQVGTAAAQERLLSYLPLSHVAGMMVDLICPVVAAALSPAWFTVHFARPYDLKVGAIKDRLCAVRPTVFLGVPLVWEKIADRLRAIGAETTGLKKKIAGWAKGLALQHARSCQLGGSGRYPLGFGAADAVVLRKIKAALGLDRCKFGFTGAAPIRVDTLEYFGSLGLNINEVYGMSECTGACTFSTDEAHAWGSCGWEMPGVEVRAFLVAPQGPSRKTECPRAPSLDCTDEKYQGELCFRGRNIMMGYMANPDLGDAHLKDIREKTAEAIDSEGWLHSGDKGMVTEAGMVKITGRYKELIIGEGGENIAPVPIEDCVKKSCDGINEVMMVGDKRKYNVALVTLKAVGANGEVPGSDALDAGARAVNPRVSTISAALDDATWIAAVTAAIEAANNNGQVCPNNAFKIQKFTILPTNFSEEKGELTPTKKLKRKVVEMVYAATIEKLYSAKGIYIHY